ncbi:hypothetical protein EGT54_03570, partial [Neisseria gonorrhoeae]
GLTKTSTALPRLAVLVFVNPLYFQTGKMPSEPSDGIPFIFIRLFCVRWRFGNDCRRKALQPYILPR